MTMTFSTEIRKLLKCFGSIKDPDHQSHLEQKNKIKDITIPDFKTIRAITKTTLHWHEKPKA